MCVWLTQLCAPQAGGLSWKKRPFLKLNPDYALKPLPADHRGYREAGFYEMVALSCEKYSKRKRIALRLSSSDDTPSDQTKIDDGIDGKEVELLSRLAHFVPSYYGIINEKNDDTNHNGKNSNRNYPKIPAPVATSHQSNLTNNAWLLLRDTTATFSRPCVIDIKIGKQTYEPGSSIEKVNEERTKYVQETSSVTLRAAPSEQAACSGATREHPHPATLPSLTRAPHPETSLSFTHPRPAPFHLLSLTLASLAIHSRSPCSLLIYSRSQVPGADHVRVSHYGDEHLRSPSRRC